MRKDLLILLALGFLSGCGLEGERKPVGPQGSAESDMPWNRPRPGEGQGAFGGVLDGQR